MTIEELKKNAAQCEQQGQLKKALALYRHALAHLEGKKALQKELDLYTRAGDLYQKLGDTKSAVALYEKGGMAFAQLGQVESVVSSCLAVHRVAPQRSYVPLRLARTMMEHGHIDGAAVLLGDYAHRNRLSKASELLRGIGGQSDDETRPILEVILEIANQTEREKIKRASQTLSTSGKRPTVGARRPLAEPKTPTTGADAPNPPPAPTASTPSAAESSRSSYGNEDVIWLGPTGKEIQPSIRVDSTEEAEKIDRQRRTAQFEKRRASRAVEVKRAPSSEPGTRQPDLATTLPTPAPVPGTTRPIPEIPPPLPSVDGLSEKTAPNPIPQTAGPAPTTATKTSAPVVPSGVDPTPDPVHEPVKPETTEVVPGANVAPRVVGHKTASTRVPQRKRRWAFALVSIGLAAGGVASAFALGIIPMGSGTGSADPGAAPVTAEPPPVIAISPVVIDSSIVDSALVTPPAVDEVLATAVPPEPEPEPVVATPPQRVPAPTVRPAPAEPEPTPPPVVTSPPVATPPPVNPPDPEPEPPAPVETPSPLGESAPTFDHAILIARNLPVSSVVAMEVGGRKGWRSTQLLPSGDSIVLTGTVFGDPLAPASQSSTPRVTRMPDGAVVGTVRYGPFLINARSSLPVETVTGILSSLVRVDPR